MHGSRAFLRRDDGVAMIAVIGISAVVTVIAITAFVLSQQALLESRRTQVHTQAFQAANAGVDAALADIQAAGFQPGHFPMGNSVGTTGSPDHMGNYVVSITTDDGLEFTAVSTGTAPDGSTETIKVRFFHMNLWEMQLAAGSNQSLTAGGGGITGTSNVTGPFYVRGNVQMGGTSFIHNGPFFVKDGNINLQGNAEIGSPTKPIRVYVSGTYPQANFYASSVSQAVPRITLPIVDMAFMTGKWNTAKAESVDNKRGGLSSTFVNLECENGDPATYRTTEPPNSLMWQRAKVANASTHYKYVGPDAGPASTLGGGTTPLIIGGTGSWGSWWGDGHYYVIDSYDDFCFDDATNTLYIEGTVFVDGPVTIAEDITYKGNGTIVANGPITVNGSMVPQGGYSSGNVNKQALGLVTPTTITINYSTNNTKDLTQEPDLAGAFFAKERISFTGNGILLKGSIIAGSITFAHPNIHLVTNPLLPTFLPEGMPGRGQKVLIPGQWVRQ